MPNACHVLTDYYHELVVVCLQFVFLSFLLQLQAVEQVVTLVRSYTKSFSRFLPAGFRLRLYLPLSLVFVLSIEIFKVEDRVAVTE